ncbi:MAG: hypothetical protein JWP66_576 [Naasia sp.]|nr:hypothetical protein [Naasia sp.]
MDQGRGPQAVEAFLDRLSDERRRVEFGELLELSGRVTGEQPELRGPSIVGFGAPHGTAPLQVVVLRKQ